ncbi:hypothetical protein RZS08_64175, partial [Arthrospira platensis SPKY1]|nr:hypothetical protein [Arthrospira platensis SPKY1]
DQAEQAKTDQRRRAKAEQGRAVDHERALEAATDLYEACRVVSGSKMIFSRVPVAFANRSSVRVEGRTRPPSRRATVDWVVFIRRASSSCVIPARARASIRAEARVNSSSNAS